MRGEVMSKLELKFCRIDPQGAGEETHAVSIIAREKTMEGNFCRTYIIMVHTHEHSPV